MNKFLNKFFLIGSSIFLFANIANAQNTVCHKNSWDSPSTIEDAIFDGGECKGKYSITQMKEQGWKVLDIKIDTNQNKISYAYLLGKGKNTPSVTTKSETSKITTNSNKKRLSFKPVGIKIDNLENNKTIIQKGDLIVGQSGVVIHLYDNDKRMIVANAQVISSNEKTSVIQFSNYEDLKQNAIPTSNRKVQKDDILVLNYLYTSSLLIAPDQDSFQIVRSNFKYNNFLHSDIFASRLRNDDIKNPTKEDLQKFAIEQNLGTIFVVVNKHVYVIDTKTFKILTDYGIDYDLSKTQKPFYTRVKFEKETSGTFGFAIFESDKILNYEAYYKKVLGLK